MRDTLLATPPTTALIRPEYTSRFRCIGPRCEDSCCAGWAVFFDRAAYERYRAIPEGPLRTLVQLHVAPLPAKADGSPPEPFARVQMTPANVCPFLNEAKLCRIQAELGEESLSVTCATFPRIVHRIDGVEEKALSLSCPEAARLVLLSPDLLSPGGHGGPGGAAARSGYVMTWHDPPWDEAGNDRAPGPDAGGGRTPLHRYFWPIREFAVDLVADRRYALWQRLFLLGIFARRLDAQARGEVDRGFVAIRRDFLAAVDSGSLRAGMDSIAPDLPLQLDMVLRLAGLRLPRSHIGPRFVETVEAFTRGIGNGPTATMETLVDRYAQSFERFYEPFFRKHPHILENLLINTIFRTVFPFGGKAGKPECLPEMAREFALLATQFALIKGLLIGVAGCYGPYFSPDHVVHTVQSASKHFEHHPGFLEQAHSLLVERGLDNPRGLTMLLRN